MHLVSRHSQLLLLRSLNVRRFTRFAAWLCALPKPSPQKEQRTCGSRRRSRPAGRIFEMLEYRALMSAQSPVADVGVAIQPLPLVPGQGAQFQVVVANAGPDATGVWLFDAIPDGLGPAQWTNGTDTGTGDINQNLNLAAGQSVVYTITGSPPANHLAQEFIDYAEVTVAPGTTDPGPSNNRAEFSQEIQVQSGLEASTYERSTAPVTLVTFDYGQNTLPPSAFDATIGWGDGTTSAADIALGQNGYYVEGSHAYADEGTYQTTVTLHTANGERSYNPWMRVHDSPMIGPDPTGSQHFIQEAYDDVLHRLPDPAGMGYWMSQLAAGMDRQTLAQTLLDSEEHAAIEVHVAFQQYLHRNSDPGATAYFATLLTRGMSAEQLDELLVTSPEYWQASGGDNEGFLKALWADALDRPGIDPEALAYFGNFLSHGGTRAQVAQHVFGSREFAQETVESLFLHYLNRPSGGDLPEVQFLMNGGSANALAVQLIASTEYFVLANG